MGMQVDSGGKKGSFNDINVTPLIDIVLVVLIIFMVITPQTIDELSVNLPKKTEMVRKKDVPTDQLVLSVCEDGRFALNKQVMPLEELSDQLRRRLAAKADKVAFVDAHPEAPYDKVVDLMDAARGAGTDKIGIARLKDADQFKGCTPDPAPALDPGAAPTGG
ncbi:MAG: biopolymer transporter ExbD [Deltaproteobacteria bacterium]|nr:MAG: biopolymer transporter ExbD [Deltaproteobacteria bacterium]